MAEAILMPRLSDTMTEGVIAAWHKKVGDSVKKGELLAEIETDKATMELESYKEGTLLHIGTEKGGKLQVNDLLAVIGQPGEDISGILKGKGTGEKTQASSKPARAGTDGGQGAGDKAQPAKKTEPAVKQATGGKVPETSKEQVTSNQQPATNKTDITKMEEVVLMPRLSDTMTEGVIASWQKNVGDTVKKGDILAEIETDKATMELESYKNGTLLYIGAKQGEKIAVNELLCIIGEKGKVDIDAIVNAAKGQGEQGTDDKEQGTRNKEQETNDRQPATSNQQASTNGQMSASSNGRIRASPLAKKLAAEKGEELQKRILIITHQKSEVKNLPKEQRFLNIFRQHLLAKKVLKRYPFRKCGKQLQSAWPIASLLRRIFISLCRLTWIRQLKAVLS